MGRFQQAVLAVLVVVLGATLLALPASAEHGFGSINAGACVDESGFHLTVSSNTHTNDSNDGRLYVKADQLSSGESFSISYRLAPPNTVTVTSEPSVAGTAPDRWQDGPFTYTLEAAQVVDGEFYNEWDIDFTATIAHGTVPFQPGDTVREIGVLDRQNGAFHLASNVAVTDCNATPEPPPSSSTTSTTIAPTTTTMAPTTTVPAPSTTTTVEVAAAEVTTSTTVAVAADTLPFTGVEHGGLGYFGLLLLIAGVSVLAAGARGRTTDQ